MAHPRRGFVVTGPVKRYQLRAFAEHARDWGQNLYVYPVISRRSRGLSVGVNLNPDAACNFDCVYCQVDRSQPPRVRTVDLTVLGVELAAMLDWATDGSLFEHPQFRGLSGELKVLRDIAFSGDGEPTTCPVFAEAVSLAAELKRERGLTGVCLVLITDACYLSRPEVEAGLTVMDANQGEIWAKLDAGTEEYFRAVNRPNYSLAHVLANIIHAARIRPVVIQSLWMRLHGQPPPVEEVTAFLDRLRSILREGGRIARVQVYTIARRTTEPYATMLSDEEVNDIAARVASALPVEVAAYYGVPAAGEA